VREALRSLISAPSIAAPAWRPTDPASRNLHTGL